MRRRLPLATLALGSSIAALLTPARAMQEPAAQAPVSAQAAAPASAEAAAQTGAKIWLGRHAEFEEYLKTAPIARLARVPVGVTRPQQAFFAEGGLAGSALLKHLPPGRRSGFWESYKSEIAAYRLDRVLGLDMVPPTVERSVEGESGSLQLWVGNCQLLKDIQQSKLPPSPRWVRQLRRQRTFDNLIANIDRNAGNLLVDDQRNLILIDHSRAFGSNTMPFMKEMLRIDREFYDRLKALDEATLMREVKPWVLDAGSVRDILKRRDKVVEQFDRLVREKGEDEVFAF
jgi:hypothetical protein